MTSREELMDALNNFSVIVDEMFVSATLRRCIVQYIDQQDAKIIALVHENARLIRLLEANGIDIDAGDAE